MERDFTRYVVFKWTDVEKCFTKEEQRELIRLGRKFQKQRQDDNKTWECLVVEHDWPEYEPVWQAIEARVDNPHQPTSLCLVDNILTEHTEGLEYSLEYNQGWKDAEITISQGYRPYLIKGIVPYCQGWNDYMRPLKDIL